MTVQPYCHPFPSGLYLPNDKFYECVIYCYWLNTISNNLLLYLNLNDVLHYLCFTTTMEVQLKLHKVKHIHNCLACVTYDLMFHNFLMSRNLFLLKKWNKMTKDFVNISVIYICLLYIFYHYKGDVILSTSIWNLSLQKEMKDINIFIDLMQISWFSLYIGNGK